MAFFLSLSVNTYLVSYDDQESYVENYYYYRVLNNCYERANELYVNLDANYICINLFPTLEPECNYIPHGVYIDFDFSNFNNYILRLYVEDFDYATTRQVCGQCLNERNEYTCLFLQQTNSAKALLHSLTREVDLVIGKMSIYHADLSNCYSTSESIFYISQQAAQFKIADNGNCVNVMQTCGQNYFSKIRLELYADSQFLEATEFDTFTIEHGTSNGVPFKIVTIYGSFANIVVLNFNEVRADLYIDCGIYATTIVYARVMTTIRLIESQFYPQVFNSLYFTLSPEKIDLVHDEITALAGMASYIADVNRVVVRVRFFNRTSGNYIYSVEFTADTFSLSSDADKVYKCSYTTNTTKCMEDLTALLLKDLADVSALIYAYLYKDQALRVFVTHHYQEIKKSCWTSSSLTFYNDRVCADLTPYNDPSCPFITPKQVSTLFRFYKPDTTIQIDMKATRKYSIQDDMCIVCSEQPDAEECLKRLPTLFSDGLYLELQVNSLEEDMSRQTLFIINTYSQDYSPLYSIIKILAIVVGCVMAALLCVSVITDLGLCKSKKKQKIVVHEMDDI